MILTLPISTWVFIFSFLKWRVIRILARLLRICTQNASRRWWFAIFHLLIPHLWFVSNKVSPTFQTWKVFETFQVSGEKTTSVSQFNLIKKAQIFLIKIGSCHQFHAFMYFYKKMIVMFHCFNDGFYNNSSIYINNKRP